MSTTRRFSFGIKSLAVLLSVLTVLLSLPLTVFSFDIGDVATSPEHDASISNSDIIEVIENRTAAEKTFRLTDGSFYTAHYDTEIHEEDENGRFNDIDNRLYRNGSVISTSNGRYSFPYKTSDDSSLFTLTGKGSSLSFSLVSAEKGIKGEIKNNKTEFDKDADPLEVLTTLDNIRASVRYENILPGTDIEYVLYGKNVKENVIVKERDPESDYTYTFTLSLEGLVPDFGENGQIDLVDPETGDTVYFLPAPAMWDAADEFSDAVSYNLSSGESGTYILSVTADARWINDESRAFPVVIDPPVYSTSSNVTDLDVLESDPDRSSPSDNSIYVSSDWRAYWKLNTLPVLPSLSKITKAELTMTCFSLHESIDGYVGVYKVTSDWDSDLTWQAVLDGDHGTPAASPSDYLKLQTVSGAGDTPLTWDVTQIVNSWYENVNYGLMFQPAADGFSGTAKFRSNDYGTGSVRPSLSITFLDMKGLEDYWTYTSQDAGFAGTGYVNNATGNLVWTIPTLTTTDALMPVSPALVYNFCTDFADYCYPNVQSANIYSMTAKGFKLNLNETLIKKQFSGPNNTTTYYFIWADGDGTEHYFMNTGHDENWYEYYYEDEDGLQLTLTEYVEGDNYCEIRDADHTVRRFEQTTTPTGLSGAYVLNSIRDKNGNRVEIYTPYFNRPTRISLVPYDEDDEGPSFTQLKLLYNNSGKLYCVYNPNSGEGVVFRYSAYYGSAVGTGYGGFLRQTVRAHGGTTDIAWENFYNTNSNSNYGGITVDAVADYTYNYLGLLAKVTNNLTGYKAGYSTYYSKRICSVYEQAGADNTQGQELYYAYGTDYSMVETSGRDDVFDNADDIYNYFTFDKSGRTVTAYSTDQYGRMIYGIGTAEYNGSEDNTKAKNSIKNSAYASDISANILLNPQFIQSGQNSFSYWTRSSTSAITFDSSAQIYNKNLYDSDYNVKLQKQSADVYLYQDVILSKGTYTFSADIMHFWDANVDVRLEVLNSGTGSQIASGKVNFRTEYYLPENVSPSVTFDVSADNSGVRVRLRLVGGSSYTNDDRILLRQMSLTKSVGAGLFGKVGYGSFEQTRTGTALSALWNASVVPVSGSSYSPSLTTETVTGFEGKSLKLTGTGAGSTYTVSQVLYEAPTSEYNAYASNPYAIHSKQYRISGRASGEKTIPSDCAKFELKLVLDIAYFNGQGQLQTDTLERSVPFSKNTEGWQYVCGMAATPENAFIKKISIVIDYSGQVGTAWFDDVSVCFTDSDENCAGYVYNENGTLKKKVSGTDAVLYLYGDSDDSSYSDELDVYAVIQRRFTTVYTYNSNHTVSTVSVYNMSSQFAGNDPWSDEAISLNSSVLTTLRTKTTYTYNEYGQVTQTSAVSSGKTVKTSTQYNTLSTDGHRFGTVKSETNSLGHTVNYSYNSTNGRLLSTTDALGNGVNYSYDGMGRISSVDAAYGDGCTEVDYSYTGANLSHISTGTTDYYMTYDEFGNRKKVTLDSAGTKALSENIYSSYNGKLTETDYGNGDKVKFIYDSLERVSEIQYNTGTNGAFVTVYRYVYDSSGNLYCFEDLTGGTQNVDRTYYKYDHNGRLAETVYAPANNGNQTAQFYLYDGEGRINYGGRSTDYKAGGTRFTALTTNTVTYSDTDGSVTRYSDSLNDYEFSANYTYDYFGRLTRKRTDLLFDGTGSECELDFTYTVPSYGNSYTSGQIKTVSADYPGTSCDTMYSYSYDANGNITGIYRNNVLKNSYEYDELGQLTRENNADSGKTTVYDYDGYGNITGKRVYNYTTSQSLSGLSYTAVNYSYGFNTGYWSGLWGDLLKSYNGQQISYDEVGNPVEIGSDISLSWTQGRLLSSYEETDGEEVHYKYNADGIRTSKTVAGKEHRYTLNGTQVLSEEWTVGTVQHLMIYVYDAEGSPVGFRYRNSTYYSGIFDNYIYGKNVQGDIIYIFNIEGNKVAEFTYDAWGKPVTAQYYNSSNNPGVTYSPFRYRGYWYDEETGLYYLNSRYYNPEWGRFLNADIYLNANGDILGFNMFAYCGNEPVNRADYSGESFWDTVKWLCKKSVDVHANFVMAYFGGPLSLPLMITTIEMHYSRNCLNKSYSEVEIDNMGIEQLKETEDKFHQNHQQTDENGEKKRNRKYVIGTWFSSEMVFYDDGSINDTPEDRGTFNVYYGDNPFGKYVIHGIFDVVPYMLWGNSLDDKTTIIDRVMRCFQ